jgi:hypothetical protein
MTQPTYIGATVGKDGAFAQAGDAASIGSRRRAGWTVCAVHRHPLANLGGHTFCVDSKWPR